VRASGTRVATPGVAVVGVGRGTAALVSAEPLAETGVVTAGAAGFVAGAACVVPLPGRTDPKYNANPTTAAAPEPAAQRVARETRRRPWSRSCALSRGMSTSRGDEYSRP
jgi:hypothetical protein